MAKVDAFIFFCDDTREEVGGRLSLMGLYGPKVNLSEDHGALKSLAVGALIRIYSHEDAVAKFSLTFTSSREDVATPPSPGDTEVTLPAIQDEGVRSTNIVGAFAGLPVHAGMKIMAKLEIYDQCYEAEVEFQIDPKAIKSPH